MSILVTGGSGMVGKALQGVLPDAKYMSSKECDLRNTEGVFDFFNEGKYTGVIHLASRVGGVKSNTDFIGDFFYDNIMINTNVLEASRKFKIKKVLSLLSTCIYPDNAQYPLTEVQIHNGKPHHSNFGYAHAKRMLDVQSRAYRQQFGCNFITAVPNNLFGKHDNFDLNDSHVIPAIIRKVYEAKNKNIPVELWGNGNPMREFTYVNDLAKILKFIYENYNESAPINIGCTEERSIAEVADLIIKFFNYNGKIIWDTQKPSGQFRKPSDNSRLIKLGWKSENYSSFKDSLKETCNWFLETYPNIRGL